MKILSIINAVIFAGLAVYDLINGEYYVAALEAIIALSNVSDFLRYKLEETK
jgi:hypothetical protein